MALEEQLSALRALHLPTGAYAVFGGSALALHGLREASDLDIAVTKTLFQKLAKEHEKDPDADSMQLGELDIWCKWLPDGTLPDKYIARATQIRGVPVATLEDMLDWKRRMNREKDQKDITLITAWLGRKGK